MLILLNLSNYLFLSLFGLSRWKIIVNIILDVHFDWFEFVNTCLGLGNNKLMFWFIGVRGCV